MLAYMHMIFGIFSAIIIVTLLNLKATQRKKVKENKKILKLR